MAKSRDKHWLKKLPASPCAWPWWATDRIYQQLGIEGRRVPPNMHGEFKIDGWNVVVKRSAAKGSRSGKPRIFVRNNGDLVPAGRVRQALCQLDVHRSRKRAAARRGPGGRFVWKR